MKLHQHQSESYNPVHFNTEKRGNVEYLFNQSACKPCSLFGLCSRGGDNGCQTSHIEHLAVQPRPLQKGEYLFRQGDKLQNLYVIRSGGVKIMFTSFDGTEQILNFHLRGGILGLSDIETGIHGTSAIALETTGICKLPYEKLQAVCHQKPYLYDQLFKIASREISNEQAKSVLLGQKQSEERFAAFILDMATRNRQNGYSYNEFNLTMSRHDIANYLCLADETVSRLISKFCNEKMLEVNRRAIRICDHRKLATRAGSVSLAGNMACVN